MLLLRAGRRPVREVEVTVGAVAFAAKLRRQASAGSDPGNDGRSRAITAPTADDLEIIAHHRNGASLEEDPTLIRQRSASAPTVPSPMPAPKEFQQKSSLQKRKENLLARARGGRPRETEVALSLEHLRYIHHLRKLAELALRDFLLHSRARLFCKVL